MPRVRPATHADLETLVAGNADMAAETEQLQLDLPTLRLGVAAVLDGRVPGRYWMAEHEGARRRSAAHHLRVERLAESAGVVDPVGARRPRGATAGACSARSMPTFAARPRRPAPAGCGCMSTTPTRARRPSTPSLGMNGGHYRVFEDMFAEPAKLA